MQAAPPVLPTQALVRDPDVEHADTPEAFLPAIYHAVAETGRRARRHHETFSLYQLILLVLASFFGGISLLVGRMDLAALLALGAFIVAGTLQSELLIRQHDRLAANADQVAVEMKSLIWRYAVGGRPFVRSDAGKIEDDARELLADLLHGLVGSLPSVDLVPYSASSGFLTEPIRDLRRQDLEERRDRYTRWRLQEERDEAAAIAKLSHMRANQLSYLLLLMQAIAILAGSLRLAGVFSWDALGFIATLAASVTAWIQLRQYREKSTKAMAAQVLLGNLETRVSVCPPVEEAWARVVDHTERAIVPGYSPIRSKASATHESNDKILLTWEEYYESVEKLKHMVTKNPDLRRRFEPDVVVSVNPGGALVGGLLVLTTRQFAFIPISFRTPTDEPAIHAIRSLAHIKPKNVGQPIRILIVDSVCKRGASLRQAIHLIRTELAGCDIEYRTAVLVYRKDLAQASEDESPIVPDYHVWDRTEAFPYGDV